MEFEAYDLAREPRPIVPAKRVLVSLEALHGDLNCAICLSVMNNTAMTLECSHRFCKECVEKSLRISSTDCPTCRGKINTRRSLREDKRLDSLIRVLFGDVSKLEEAEAELKSSVVTERYNPSPVLAQVSTAVEEEDRSPSREAYVGGRDDVLFVLRRHPSSLNPPLTSLEYIRAPHSITVKSLEKFLIGCAPSSASRVEIFYFDGDGEEYSLNSNLSVDEILRTFKRSSRAADLVLHYKAIKM